jgi:hypothetical protein
MQACCVEVLQTMQDRIEASRWLKMMLVASPFIILLPESPVEQAADLLKDMAVEKAVERINEGSKLPDVADAVKAVDVILRSRLHDDAVMHYIRHSGPEARFWQKLADVYR